MLQVWVIRIMAQWQLRICIAQQINLRKSASLLGKSKKLNGIQNELQMFLMHGVLNYAAPEWRDGVIAGKANTRGVLEILGDLGTKAPEAG